MGLVQAAAPVAGDRLPGDQLGHAERWCRYYRSRLHHLPRRLQPASPGFSSVSSGGSCTSSQGGQLAGGSSLWNCFTQDKSLRFEVPEFLQVNCSSEALLSDMLQIWVNEIHIPAEHLQVVLVGHSMGGLSTLLAMERHSHKIGLAIFVAAVVTPSGKALADTPLHAMVRVLTP